MAFHTFETARWHWYQQLKQQQATPPPVHRPASAQGPCQRLHLPLLPRMLQAAPQEQAATLVAIAAAPPGNAIPPGLC